MKSIPYPIALIGFMLRQFELVRILVPHSSHIKVKGTTIRRVFCSLSLPC